MSSNVRVELKWEGVSTIDRYIASVIPGIIKDSELAALDRAADKAKEAAKQLCPVGTPESTGISGYVGGSLRDSIRKEKAVSEGEVVYVGIRAGGYVTNPNTGRLVDYALYVEYGTSRMQPRPFIRPALAMAKALMPVYLYEELSARAP